MAMTRAGMEPLITANDLRSKWAARGSWSVNRAGHGDASQIN
jgi:hypothetical protein